MAENKHTLSDLYQMQSLSLESKIRMTCYRIRQWVDAYGEDGVYVSFSGGKDSTVLLDLVRNECGFRHVPAVFVDVPTQYPELKTFAKKFCEDNEIELTILKPKISFMEVCKKYGFPLFGKETAGAVHDARIYMKKMIERANEKKECDAEPIRGAYAFADVIGVERRRGKKEQFEKLKVGIVPESFLEGAPVRFKMLFGKVEHKEKGVITEEFSTMYDKSRYKFMLDADFEISDACCKVMKKQPTHKYQKDTGRNPMTAQMASESRLRTSNWLKNGCNGFDLKIPTSNPMSFWTEQDVLLYIKTRNLPICSVYGDVVFDTDAEGQVEGQMDLSEMTQYGVFDTGTRPLKTTGCNRTGCVLCGFGCHLEKDDEARFVRLKETHPGLYGLLDVIENNGVTYRQAIDWVNEHGHLNIKY